MRSRYRLSLVFTLALMLVWSGLTDRVARAATLTPANIGGSNFWRIDYWDVDGAGVGTDPNAVVIGQGGTPALSGYGSGSLQLWTGPGSGGAGCSRLGGKPFFGTDDLAGKRLDEITRLSFSLLVEADSGDAGADLLAPYVNIFVDLNGDNAWDGAADSILVFEPLYSASGTGSPTAHTISGAFTKNVWYTFDGIGGAGNGRWHYAAQPPTGSDVAQFTPNSAVDDLWTEIIDNPTTAALKIVNPPASGCGVHGVEGTTNGLTFVTGQKNGGAWRNHAARIDNISLTVTGAVNDNFDIEPAAAPTPTTLVVEPGNLQGWSILTPAQVGLGAPAVSTWVTGPGTPPLGTDSYRVQITSGATKAQFASPIDFTDNTPITALLDTFSYSTYASSSTNLNPFYINLYIDTNNDDTCDKRLDFAPATSTLNVWETWNAADGTWQLKSGGCFGSGTFTATTLSAYSAANPGATIWGLVLNMGDSASNYVGWDGSFDAVTIGTTTYDWENTPNAAPVNTVPAAATTPQDTALAFTAANFGVTDTDAGSGTLDVTISVTSGGGTFSATASGSATVTGSGTATLGISGSLTDINATLDAITYTPASGFSGTVNAQMVTDDNGNTGSGGVKTDTDAFTINVTASGTVSVSGGFTPASIETGSGSDLAIAFTNAASVDATFTFTSNLALPGGSTVNGTLTSAGAGCGTTTTATVTGAFTVTINATVLANATCTYTAAITNVPAAGTGTLSGTNFNVTTPSSLTESVGAFGTLTITTPPPSGGGGGDDDDDGDDDGGGAPAAASAPTVGCDEIGRSSGGALTASGTVGNILVNGVGGSTYCRPITLDGRFVQNPAELGKPEVIALQPQQAVDLFGLLPGGVPAVPFNTPVRLCLRGVGNVFFIDAADASRSVRPLSVVSADGGYTCVDITGSGTVALVGGSPLVAPAAPAQTAPSALTDCRVTTTAAVRLREAPNTDSTIITTVPFQLTLTATERVDGWYRVIFESGQGWISADFLTTDGACG